MASRYAVLIAAAALFGSVFCADRFGGAVSAEPIEFCHKQNVTIVQTDWTGVETKYILFDYDLQALRRTQPELSTVIYERYDLNRIYTVKNGKCQWVQTTGSVPLPALPSGVKFSGTAYVRGVRCDVWKTNKKEKTTLYYYVQRTEPCPTLMEEMAETNEAGKSISTAEYYTTNFVTIDPAEFLPSKEIVDNCKRPY